MCGGTLANPEPDVANGFPAEAFFQLPQDFDLGNLFELVMQVSLKNGDVKDRPFA